VKKLKYHCPHLLKQVFKLALIVEGALRRGFAAKGVHSGVYIQVPKSRLSQQYNLYAAQYAVKGEVLDIKKLFGELSGEELKLKELIGQRISFTLSVAAIGTHDFLYISEESWPLFRDYGVFPDEYVLKVKLTHIKVDEEVLEIYPKRDVVA